jgi:hypothetical protein
LPSSTPHHLPRRRRRRHRHHHSPRRLFVTDVASKASDEVLATSSPLDHTAASSDRPISKSQVKRQRRWEQAMERKKRQARQGAR